MRSEPERELSASFRSIPRREHRVWCSVITGEQGEPEEFAQSLVKKLSIEVSFEAVWLIIKICHAGFGEPKGTKFVVKTAAELSKRSWQEQGLELCPPDAALALRFQYAGLRVGDKLRIMSPPVDIAGAPYVFSVVRTAFGLNMDVVRADSAPSSDERMIFALPYKTERAD